VLGESCSSSEENIEIHTKFWPENIKGRYNIGDVPVDMRIISNSDKRVLTGFI
jgi:hypothetical protein